MFVQLRLCLCLRSRCIMSMFVVMLLILHSLGYKFFVCICHIQQRNHAYLLIFGRMQHIGHPFIRSTAYITEEICLCNCRNILHGRLIAVQICAALNQQRYCNVRHISHDLPHPVIFRENSTDNLYSSSIGLIAAAPGH